MPGYIIVLSLYIFISYGSVIVLMMLSSTMVRAYLLVTAYDDDNFLNLDFNALYIADLPRSLEILVRFVVLFSHPTDSSHIREIEVAEAILVGYKGPLDDAGCPENHQVRQYIYLNSCSLILSETGDVYAASHLAVVHDNTASLIIFLILPLSHLQALALVMLSPSCFH